MRNESSSGPLKVLCVKCRKIPKCLVQMMFALRIKDKDLYCVTVDKDKKRTS